LVARVRAPLIQSVAPLQFIADRVVRRVLLVALIVGAGAAAAHTAFVHYFLLKPEEYLELQTYLPALIALGTLLWALYARRARAPIEAWLRAELAGRSHDGTPEPRALAAYRSAQSLPYRLAGVRLLM